MSYGRGTSPRQEGHRSPGHVPRRPPRVRRMTALAERYFAGIGAFDRAAIMRLVEESLASGTGVDTLLDVVTASQAWVGELWQGGEWTIAHEHAATAINQVVVDLLSFHHPAPAKGRVVVACLEDEWHSLPALVLAGRLRERRWDVIFLGASTPASSLDAFLGGASLNALVASCTISTTLAAVPAMSEACHHAGLPVVLGGRALAGNPTRGRRLGVDAQVNSLEDLDALLLRWTSAIPSPFAAAERIPDEVLRLRHRRRFLVSDAVALLEIRFPVYAPYSPGQGQRTEDDLRRHFAFLEAALITQDAGVYVEFVEWMWLVLEPRGVPLSALTISLEILAELLSNDFVDAHRVVAEGMFHMAEKGHALGLA